MNSIFSKASSAKCRKLAKSYIVWVCGLSLLFFGLAASAEESSALRFTVSSMYSLLDDWNANLRYGGAWDQWHSNLSQQLSTDMGGISTQLSYVLGWLNNNSGYGSNDNLKYYLQRILAEQHRAGDLAANPWWATNSNFSPFLGSGTAFRSINPNNAVPVNADSIKATFPELLSWWSAQLNARVPNSSGYTWTQWRDMFNNGDYQKLFGVRRLIGLSNLGHANLTWFDWVSEVMISNQVLSAGTFASSYHTLTNDVAEAGFTEDHTVTNAALPQHVNVISETQSDTSAGQASAAAGGQVLSAKVEELQDMLDGQKDSWITVIPEFDVGGIHVRQYEANMNTSITQACHSVMVFLWYVILFASLFNLAQTELAFYLNLGRTWTMSGGVVHGK